MKAAVIALSVYIAVSMPVGGVIHNVQEPEHDPETIAAEMAEAGIYPEYDIDPEAIPLDPLYVEYVCEVCREYTMDPAVLFGMMYQESRFRSEVVGDHGKAFGILQVQPRWHQERMQRLGVTDLTDPWQAIWVACDYLAEIREDHPDIRQMLTIYRYGTLEVSGEDYAGIVLEQAETYRTK